MIDIILTERDCWGGREKKLIINLIAVGLVNTAALVKGLFIINVLQASIKTADGWRGSADKKNRKPAPIWPRAHTESTYPKIKEDSKDIYSHIGHKAESSGPPPIALIRSAESFCNSNAPSPKKPQRDNFIISIFIGGRVNNAALPPWMPLNT